MVSYLNVIAKANTHRLMKTVCYIFRNFASQLLNITIKLNYTLTIKILKVKSILKFMTS